MVFESFGSDKFDLHSRVHLCTIEYHFLLGPVLLSLLFSVIQTYFEISEFFYVNFFNVYQPLVNSGFFFLGSFYYSNKNLFGPVRLVIVSAFSFITTIFIFFHAELNINMADHSFAPNFYYVGLSYTMIFLVLGLKPVIQWALDSAWIIDWVVLKFSKHSYSVFIIHSFLIYFSESAFLDGKALWRLLSWQSPRFSSLLASH